MKELTKLVASTGLIIGGVFGMLGSFAPSPILRSLAWAFDGVCLIIAAALLVVYYFRKGNDGTAVGFLIFALGESLILGTSAIDFDSNLSTFAAGTGLWAASLFVISSQKTFPVAVRIVGAIAAMLFTVVAVQVFTGEAVNPLTKPLPFFAYPFFVCAIFGWAWKLLSARTTQPN